MNPDELLDELRQLLVRAQTALDSGIDAAAAAVLGDFVEKFRALDEWMSSTRSYKPTQWCNNVPPRVVDDE